MKKMKSFEEFKKEVFADEDVRRAYNALPFVSDREVFSDTEENFIERYSDDRIEGFLSEDKISKKIKRTMEKFLL